MSGHPFFPVLCIGSCQISDSIFGARSGSQMSDTIPTTVFSHYNYFVAQSDIFAQVDHVGS